MNNIDTAGFFTDEVKSLMIIVEKAGYEIRIVGGCLRDWLAFKKTPHDVDFTTTAKPNQIKQIFAGTSFKPLDTTAENFGCVMVVSNDTGTVYEITTLRSDINPNGRHTEVEYISDFEQDANRRDFTVNALSMDLSGKIYDYFGGLDDIKNSIIKFVGKPEDRICEDFLRIMRYYRFKALFNTRSIDEKSEEACEKLMYSLNRLSKERFTMELIKYLKLNTAFGVRVNTSTVEYFVNAFTESKKLASYDIKIYGHDLSKLDKDQILYLAFNGNSYITDMLDISNKEKNFFKEAFNFDKVLECYQWWDVRYPEHIVQKAAYVIKDKNILSKILQLDLNLPSKTKNFLLTLPTMPIDGNYFKDKYEGRKIGIAMDKALDIWIGCYDESVFFKNLEKMLCL